MQERHRIRRVWDALRHHGGERLVVRVAEILGAGVKRILLRALLAVFVRALLAAAFTFLAVLRYRHILRREELRLRLVELDELVLQLIELLLFLNADLRIKILFRQIVGLEVAPQLIDFFFELAYVIVVLLVNLLTRELLLPRVELWPHMHGRDLAFGDAAGPTMRNHWIVDRDRLSRSHILLLWRHRRPLTLAALVVGHLAGVKVIDLLRRL